MTDKFQLISITGCCWFGKIRFSGAVVYTIDMNVWL